MAWQTLYPQIKTLLEEKIDLLQEVSEFPKLTFTGYPAAYIAPSDSSADYETTRENERVYAFFVRFFYETKNTPVADATTYLRKVVDQALDELDKEDQRGGTRTIGQDLPTGYTFLSIMAHPSAWGEVQDQNLIVAEIKCSVRVSRDVTP